LVTALCGDATMAATGVTSQGGDELRFTVAEASAISPTSATNAEHKPCRHRFDR
jgi:hypothetical protein